MEELEENGVEIDGQHIKINWFLCSDWKFLAAFLGLNAAQSEFFCLWCHCDKSQISDLDKPQNYWKITRTYVTCVEDATKADTDGRKGCMDDPLFKVDFKKIIPDTLHLFLRTSEILVENLQEWAVKAKKRQELEEAAFKAGVNMRCEEDKNGTYVWSDLNGCELEKLMKNIDLSPLLADHPHHDNILSLWRLLPKLYTALRVPTSSPSYLSPAEFHRTAKLFSRKLRVVYKDINITPYIHCLVFHIPQFLEMYGTIYQFNCQLVEKKNQQHTSFFHRGTQKGGVCSSHCRQIMQRENRRLFARHNDYCVDIQPVRKRTITLAARQALRQRVEQFRQQKAARRQKIIAHREAVKKARACKARQAAAARRRAKKNSAK